jgi:hypothetical protein
MDQLTGRLNKVPNKEEFIKNGAGPKLQLAANGIRYLLHYLPKVVHTVYQSHIDDAHATCI